MHFTFSLQYQDLFCVEDIRKLVLLFLVIPSYSEYAFLLLVELLSLSFMPNNNNTLHAE